MKEIHAAIEASDAQKLRASAHALKGSVSNFVRDGPYSLALQLEQKGRAEDLSDVESIYSDLRNEIDSFCETLKEVQNS